MIEMKPLDPPLELASLEEPSPEFECLRRRDPLDCEEDADDVVAAPELDPALGATVSITAGCRGASNLRRVWN